MPDPRQPLFEILRGKGFEVLALHHAEAILRHDMQAAVDELEAALREVRLPVAEVVRSGGGEGQLTQRLRKNLSDTFGWKRHVFQIKKSVDGEETESLTHQIDHVRKLAGGTVAFEIEWNNKDPFFDRDLESFKRLHAEGAISVGGIITRGTSLQDGIGDLIEQFARVNRIDGIARLREFYTPTRRQLLNIEKAVRASGSFEKGWASAFVADKFGESTTHWRKLQERIRRGVGNPCPLLLIGIPREVVTL